MNYGKIQNELMQLKQIDITELVYAIPLKHLTPIDQILSVRCQSIDSFVLSKRIKKCGKQKFGRIIKMASYK